MSASDFEGKPRYPAPHFTPAVWRKIDEWLNDVLELSSAEKHQWLAALTPEQAPYRETLTSMLLHAQMKADSFMATPVGEAIIEAAAATLHSDKAGDNVGAYRLIQQIGAGGMATVWLAKSDLIGINRYVALKLPMTTWASNIAARMLRERDILATFTHTNIAKLFDAGVTISGRPFLAMEYIEGVAIDVYVRLHQLSTDEILKLFLQVTHAVSHAHARLIVHRDLKPSNIMVDQSGQVKLLDFGVAKLLDDDAPDELQLTHKIGHAFTPNYASPEQIRKEVVTVASDVYSLGVVLYELLTGQRPYALRRHSNAALESAIVDAEIKLASTQTGISRTRQRQLKGDIDNVLSMALKKNTAERYQSVEAFSADIERFLKGDVVLARADTMLYRGRKFVTRNRSVLIAVVVIVVVLIAGIIGTMSQARLAEQATIEAKLERDRAIQELSFTEVAEEFMRFLLSEQSNHSFTTETLLGRAEALIDEQFVNDAMLRARMLLLVADLYGELEDYKRAEIVLARAHQAAVLTNNVAMKAEIDCTLAGLYAAVGKSSDAAALFQEALTVLNKTNKNNNKLALQTCYLQRTTFNRNVGNADEALADAISGLQIIGKPRPGQRAIAAHFRSAIADAKSLKGRHQEAIQIYAEAYHELMLAGRGNTSAARGLGNNLIYMNMRAGQHLSALEVYDRLLTHANLRIDIPMQLNYARLMTELGRSKEAIPAIESAIGVATKNGNPRAIAFANLYAANAWHALGNAGKSRHLLLLAESQLRAVVPKDNVMFGLVALHHAEQLLHQQSFKNARPYLVKATTIFANAADKNPIETRANALLAQTELALGNKEKAIEIAQRAVDMSRQQLRGYAHSEWLGRALLVQGQVQYALSDSQAALLSFTESYENLIATVGRDAATTLEAAAMMVTLKPRNGS
jgi:eukaryotic-like serine/threonine-protein kinase